MSQPYRPQPDGGAVISYRFKALDSPEEYFLDEHLFELRLGDTKIPMRRQAFDVLTFLLRNQDRVVSKDELMVEIWEERAVTDNSLSRCIADIRAALGEGGRKKKMLVKTVHRRGFQFVGSALPAVLPFPSAWTATESRRPGSPAVKTLGVLPFASTTDDPREARFGLGVTEELVRCLASWRMFPVISAGPKWERGFATRADFQRAAQELGAQYLVDGRVQREDDQVRVRVHLRSSDADVLWSRFFDGKMSHFFGLQSEIAESITGALYPEMISDAIRSDTHGPDNLDAWRLTLRGLARFFRVRERDHKLAIEHFTDAMKLDPRLWLPAYYYGHAQHLLAYYQWTDDFDACFKEVRRAATRCLEIDPESAGGKVLEGLARMSEADGDGALASLEQAVQRNPSLAEARSLFGQVLAMRGRAQEGIAQVKVALRLSPNDPLAGGFMSAMALGHFGLADYAESASWSERAILQNPLLMPNHLSIASASALCGKPKRAQEALARLGELNPNFSAYPFERLLSSTLPEARERFYAGLSAAGLPVSP